MSADLLVNEIEQIHKELDASDIPSFQCNARAKRGKYGEIKGPLDIAAYIDHSTLKQQLTYSEVMQLCKEVKAYGFRGACVNSRYVEDAKKMLEGTESLVVAVCGFPLGMNLSDVKAYEAERVVALGADEVDMVISVSLLKSAEYKEVFEDIRAVVVAAKERPVKVILENCLLEYKEKIAGCLLAKRAGAAFVKTSTGFSTGGATIEDIALMRAAVGDDIGLKAAGGVRDYLKARAMIEAGADCLGCTASIKILEESKA